MSNKIMSQLALVLLLLSLNLRIGYAHQNPFRDPNICGAPQCENFLNKFGFKDKIYKYQYTLDLATEFSGTGGNASNLFMKAFLDIHFPKPCQGFLKITDVKLWDQVKPNDKENNNNYESSNRNSNEDDYYGEFSDSSSDGDNLDDANDMHPKSLDLAEYLKMFKLRFSFNDGLISEVCPDPKESVWTLNIKKGILSAFQNTMLRFDVDLNTTEVDTSGECGVKYSLEDANDDSIKIRKTKDVSSCRNRYSTNSILQTSTYNFRDDKTIWPVLDSKSYCDMTINNNIYQEIACYEQHLLIPFSNNDSGVITKVFSQLVLQEEEDYSQGEFLDQQDEIVEKRSSLLFDHTPSIKPTNSEIKLARDLLKEICSLGFPYIQRDFINVFTTFLHTIRQLDYDALTQLLTRSTSICEKGKTHVLDSLPYVSSTPSYQLMRDQLLTNNVPKKMALNWLKSLSFIQRPDEDTVETFYTILEFSRTMAEPEYALCASAVIHSYCRYNIDCRQNMRVQWIKDSLETEFIKNFNAFRGEQRLQNRLIVILKSIGNIGILSEHFVEQLQKIITDHNVPIAIRLESIFAFRRANCNHYRSYFLHIYTNFTINSEVRIASYLQAMMCPDYHSINKIKNVLKYEEVNQVGSFVWSHLKTLAKSSSPVNIAIQSLLLNDDLADKFKLDPRKFSRYYQQNFFFDEYNFGSTTDMSVIFGTESYLPRMATLNLTANLFGHSINLFEITARAEGFEQLFTSNLSPERLFNLKNLFYQKGLKDIMNIAYNLLEGNIEGLSNNSTNEETASLFDNAAREIAKNNSPTNDIYGIKKCRPNCPLPIKDVNERRKSLQKGIDELGYALKYDYNNPLLQFGIRNFGNDLHYYTLSGMPEFSKLAKEFNILKHAKTLLSGNEIKYTKSNVFLDTSYIVPLGAGLPLSINIFGASSIDLRTSGKLEQMYTASDSSKWHFNVHGTLKPTVLVDIIGSMSSDMFYAQSGVKVKTTMYSNTEVSCDLKVRGKNLITFSFNLPLNTSEIFSAQSELLKITREQDEPQTGIMSRTENSTCTWPMLETAIGLKICIDYSVPNVNNSKKVIYPSLLLSGPMNFSIVLEKSDLSTKKWIFEYTSEQPLNGSKWAITAHTPHSSFQRLFMANVSTTPEMFHSSIIFVHGQSKASAVCQFIKNRNNWRFDATLDTNENRSLELHTELKRYQEQNVLIYKPRMLLAINGVNITGAVGTVRINEKNGVAQSDMDLSFETRKLQMLIRGFIAQSEVKKSANITINYRFQANKIESIHFEGRLKNHGDKSRIEYEGNMNLQTSAHPKLNFASNMTWRSLQGHTEGILAVDNLQNGEVSGHPSVFHLVLARSHPEGKVWEGSRLLASFDVKIPRFKIDYKLYLNHEERYKNGSENNVLVGVRLSPEKEASVLFSLLLPHQQLLVFDAFFNISISNFNSCFGRLKFAEKFPKTYMINFNGTWFTEQFIVVRAKHMDHSTRLQALKMIIESGSFDTIALNASYRRIQTFIYSNVQVKYGEQPYGLVMKLNSQPDIIKTSICEINLQLREKIFWLNTSVLLKEPLMLQVEIHLDKLRDIYIKLSVLNLDTQKELSLELNWDNNRDPSKRLLLLAELKQPTNNENHGQVLVKYPDRTLSFTFNANTLGSEYNGDVYASWATNELINVNYNILTSPAENINNRIQIEVYTPFTGWRNNSLNAGVYNFGNLFLVNSSLLWGESQCVELICKSDISIDNTAYTQLDMHFELKSSIVEMPSINMAVKHLHDPKQFDTDVSLHYRSTNQTMKVYSLKSKWELSNNQQYQNISGSIFVLSPHTELWKGGIITKICISDKRKIFGAASITFNLREITLVVDGYVNKYNDNMITINITTPLNNFRAIKGRFGLIENKRHVVAEISTPVTALGIEVLLDIKSLAVFDVRLSVATPVANLRQIALFTKLNREKVDMRCVLNNMTVGFAGAWYMNDIADFEYSCKVFTPLKYFEENGVVFKFLKTDLFVLNLHAKFSHYKFGIQMHGKSKSPILKQLGNKMIELESKYDVDFKPPQMEDNEYTNIEDIDYDEFFSYDMEVLLDLLVWPTIEGMLEFEEVLDYYFTLVSIKLPQGYVDIKNNLYFPDYLNIINVLNIEAPPTIYNVKNIKLIMEHHVDLNFQNFYEKLHCVFNKNGILKDIGFEANYSHVANYVETPEYNLKLNLALPSGSEIDIIGKIHFEDTLFRGYIKTIAGKTCLLLEAAFETEDNLVEAGVDISLEGFMSSHYNWSAYFKQNFSELDNSLLVTIKVINVTDISEFHAEYSWQCNNNNDVINSNGKIITTMLPLKNFEYSFLLNKGKTPQINIDLGFSNQHGIRMDYGIRAIKRNEVINTELWTPIANFKNISIHGTLIPLSAEQYKVDGVLYRDMVTYNLSGELHTNDGYLKQTRLQIRPLTGGPDGSIEISVTKNNDAVKGVNFKFDAIENEKFCKVTGSYSYDKSTGLDLNVLLQSTEAAVDRIYLLSRYQSSEKDHTVAKLILETPWQEYGLEKVDLWLDVGRRTEMDSIKLGYTIDKTVGYGKCEWIWKPEEKLRLLIESNIERSDAKSSFVFTELQYVNPNINFQNLGVSGKLSIGSLLNFEVNGTLNYVSIDDIKFGMITRLPVQYNEVHEVRCRYRGNIISKQEKNADALFEGEYSENISKRSFLTRLTYQNFTDLRSMGLVQWGSANNMSLLQADFQLSGMVNARREFYAKLVTPKFDNEGTLLINGSYDENTESYKNLIWSLHYPTSRRIADMNFSVQSLENLHGQLNCSTPFLEAPWIKAVLNFSTHGGSSHRFCRVDWPKNFSFIKLINNQSQNRSNSILNGNIELEVPLNTRHRAVIRYMLNEKPKQDKGSLKIYYNENLLVNGTYQQTKYNAINLKETTDIKINNIIKPIGIHFVNSSGIRNTNRNFSLRHIEIFDLNNSKNFNLTCQLHVLTSIMGKEIKLVAIHPNRTVILTNNYKTSNTQTINNRGRLELSKTAWIGYNIVLGNNDTNNNEIRNFAAELSYPKRNITVDGYYVTTSHTFNSNLSLKWSSRDANNLRAVSTSLLWRNEALGPDDRDNQTIILALNNHLLEKGIHLKGSFYRGIRELVKANVQIEYAYDSDHMIGISTSLKDLKGGFDITNYVVQFLAYHKASELDVQFNGSVTARPRYFRMQTKSLYRKDYFPEKNGRFLILFDSNNKEVEYMRKSPYRTVRVWMQPITMYPVYGLNATLWDTPTFSNTGYMFIDLFEKEAHMYFNLTEDGSHTLHMFGCIPNARNTYIDIWRNYEELNVVDFSSYLKLNHSRHLSGRIHWRPKIKNELKEKVNSIKEALLSSYTDIIDFWAKTLYMETLSAITDVWETTRDYNQEFINDVSQLSVLKDDLEDLRLFINKSYESNDFYIKTFVNFTYAVIDEIALRDHVDSFPNILYEIRQVLGESGKALSKSMVQFIDMIRSTYNNVIQAINDFFQGHSLKYLTDIMEKGLEKYEKFIKETHISFINHIEIFWNKFSNAMSTYFREFLKRLEPHIFRAISFVEKLAWDFSQDVLSYIYERTNELAESAYFNQVSGFTQDIENLYKDIKSNEFFLNIKKYASICWRFLKEKYYKLIPFGSELKEVVNEIWHEIKELEKIRQLQFVINKIRELTTDIEWFAEEIRFKSYLHQLYMLLRSKLRNYALNALEISDMYREAKTKFIYYPEEGVIDLEQKLPISWHAFNETPKFQEVPEYQLISDVQNLLNANNTSVLEHLYDLQSYMDPTTWLIPPNSRAFLIDSRLYISFDKRLVKLNFKPNCTYVLSHDFWNNSFTLCLDISTSHNSMLPITKFNLIAKGHIFEVDPTTDTLTLDGTPNPLLPINIDDITIQRDSNILSVSSGDGYKLECNMQFDLCWFEVSSQYFGKIAGLLGTMNNEPFDDFTIPSNTIVKSEEIFADAWSLNTCSKGIVGKTSKAVSEDAREICHQLFSSLTHCANYVDPQNFIIICMELSHNSNRLEPWQPTSKGFCTAALAYIEVCRLAKIPMRIPQQCVFCGITNGSFVPESTFLEYNTDTERRSSDIVFIVEAKTCNTYTKENKSIDFLLTTLEDQLHDHKFINNRYAIVAFGSQLSPFDAPRIISQGNGVFVNSTDKLRQYFDHVTHFINNINGSRSNSDILEALSTAAKLNFRPGVSKIFILLSCSQCNEHEMRFDYLSILQYMKEDGVRLHILVDLDLNIDKPRNLRHFFGFDKQFVYSNRFPDGESGSRQALQISKSNLGVCTPLALETGGSVFTLRRSLADRKNTMRRFGMIFAKRVVQSVVPVVNQICECTGHNTGMAYLVCTPSALANQKSSFEIHDPDFSGLDWQSEMYDL